MKKFLLISLLILSTNALSMNRIVNRATRVARIATVLRNQHLKRSICSSNNNEEKCCYDKRKQAERDGFFSFIKVAGGFFGACAFYEIIRAKFG